MAAVAAAWIACCSQMELDAVLPEAEVDRAPQPPCRWGWRPDAMNVAAELPPSPLAAARGSRPLRPPDGREFAADQDRQDNNASPLVGGDASLGKRDDVVGPDGTERAQISIVRLDLDDILTPGDGIQRVGATCAGTRRSSRFGCNR